MWEAKMALLGRTITLPTDFSRDGLWVDANDILNNGTTPADGTAVVPVNRMATGTISQSTGTAQGTLKRNIQNGKPALRLDGGDWYTVSDFTYTSNLSIIAVTQQSSNAAYLIGSGVGLSGRPAILSSFNNGGVQAFEWFNGSGRTVISTTASGFNIVEAYTDSSTCNCYFNNSLVPATFGDAISGRTLIRLFTDNLNSTFYTADVLEIIIFRNLVLSAWQRQRLYDSLKLKWGL